MTGEAERMIRMAMAAEPTPGPWHFETRENWRTASLRGEPVGGRPNIVGHISASPLTGDPLANAEFIAACSPGNISALLADRDAREAQLLAEVARLRARLEISMPVRTKGGQ